MQLKPVTYALGVSLIFRASAFAQNVVTPETNFTFAMVPTGGVEACIPGAKGSRYDDPQPSIGRDHARRSDWAA
jgi:hypothetical protein